MKNYLIIAVMCLGMGAQASQYTSPSMYGNALSGYYNLSFPNGGASVPLYTLLSVPPSWSTGTGYTLNQVIGANSWINSGLTQFSSTGKSSIQSTDTVLANSASSYPFLLNGGALWSINSANLNSFVTQNSAQPLSYLNAALIEYFSARLAMAASAFIAPASGGNTNNAFLNMLYPSSQQGVKNEQGVITNFATAAQNLFSWSRYMRNLTVPDALGLTMPNGTAITQANGFTLGALETFAGAVVITPTKAPSMSPASSSPGFTQGWPTPAAPIIALDANGNQREYVPSLGVRQVVIPSGQQSATSTTQAVSTTTCPNGHIPVAQGLVNLTYPITVEEAPPYSSERLDSTNDLGRTSFKRIVGGNTVYFFPVSTQVYNTVSSRFPCNPSFYAVQETADNWANAPVASSGSSYFRQVALRPTAENSLSVGAYILAVGLTNAPSNSAATAAPTIITEGSVTPLTGYDQYLSAPAQGTSAPQYTALNVDTLSDAFGQNTPAVTFNYSDPNFINFFADKQPWALVVQMVPTYQYNQPPSGTPLPVTDSYAQSLTPAFNTAQAYLGSLNPCSAAGAGGCPNGYYATIPQVIGVVKLNSMDFPLFFSQDPIAQGYTAYATGSSQGGSGFGTLSNGSATSSTVPANYSYGDTPLVANRLLPASGSTSPRETFGIAFSQRDVWMGVENLYKLTLQSPTNTSSGVNNYSFAYLFLQALFNGHLYSSSPKSLYRIMQKNNKITGTQGKGSGLIGDITYDYTTEKNLPLYPVTSALPISSQTAFAKDIWPINELRPQPAQTDWLGAGSPLDWVFLRALMVGRALMENTGVTAAALPSLLTIMSSPTSASVPSYTNQSNAVYVPAGQVITTTNQN